MLTSGMSTLPAYEREPYRTELDAVVLSLGEDQGRPYALLSDTVLYPEGGGQPADRGFLGRIEVLGVRKAEDGIRHYLAEPVPPGPVKVRLDWARRFDHMQQHTGQHVLTAVAQERFGWATTAFHLGEERCDIELATPNLAPGELLRLEDAVAGMIRSARPILARRVPLETYQTLQVRSRGLPEGHQGEVRLVEIEGLDLNTCGGTHLRNTAELECLKLLGSESIRGGTRLFFLAGGRVRQRLEAHERRNAALRTLLGAPDEELKGALEGKLEQVRTSEKRVRLLEEELAATLAEALAAAAGPAGGTALRRQGRRIPAEDRPTAAGLRPRQGRLPDLLPGGRTLLRPGRGHAIEPGHGRPRQGARRGAGSQGRRTQGLLPGQVREPRTTAGSPGNAARSARPELARSAEDLPHLGLQ